MMERNNNITSFLFFMLFIAVTIVMVIFFHIAAFRLFTRLKKVKSPQKFTVKYLIAANIPVLLFFRFFFTREGFGFFDFLYIFLIFNCVSYVYFHFFNMSETARRIRILAYLFLKGGRVGERDLYSLYSLDELIAVRMKRLKEMSQIEEAGESEYILKKKLLFRVSELILFFRRMLGFSKH